MNRSYEPLRPVGTPSILWINYYKEHTRLEAYRVERDALIKTFDAIPFGLRPEYLRLRTERLMKRSE